MIDKLILEKISALTKHKFKRLLSSVQIFLITLIAKSLLKHDENFSIPGHLNVKEQYSPGHRT